MVLDLNPSGFGIPKCPSLLTSSKPQSLDGSIF